MPTPLEMCSTSVQTIHGSLYDRLKGEHHHTSYKELEDIVGKNRPLM